MMLVVFILSFLCTSAENLRAAEDPPTPPIPSNSIPPCKRAKYTASFGRYGSFFLTLNKDCTMSYDTELLLLEELGLTIGKTIGFVNEITQESELTYHLHSEWTSSSDYELNGMCGAAYTRYVSQ
jgi:hypothetical protein